MTELTICWVAWIKDGHISHLTAGPFVDSEQAQAAAYELNIEDRYQRNTVVYSTIHPRTEFYD